jgi:hypothetical protein
MPTCTLLFTFVQRVREVLRNMRSGNVSALLWGINMRKTEDGLGVWGTGSDLASAALASQLSAVATGAIYVLAGIPQLVGLCFNLSVGHIDTHVLMTLAVFGTLAIGGALEVRAGSPPVVGLR